jgi:hypothetical protein
MIKPVTCTYPSGNKLGHEGARSRRQLNPLVNGLVTFTSDFKINLSYVALGLRPLGRC